MIVFKYVVIVAVTMVSFCYAGDVKIGQRLRRDADSNVQKIFEILTRQDEKLNRLHTLVVTNQFLSKCTAAFKTGKSLIATKCWKDMMSEIRTSDQSTATEMKLLGQFVTDAYDGEKSRLINIVDFIKSNYENGSELANDGYKALLNAMDDYGQLYLKKIATDDGLGSGMVDYTYRTLIAIRKVEGDASPIFTQLLPSVVLSILSGREVFIRNSVTNGFMYAPTNNSNEDVAKIRVNDGGNEGNDPRYIWRLKPVEFRWNEYNQESFYIENAFDNKILAVADGKGLLRLAEATEEKLKSTWAMFYIRLVQGSSGEEVAIQCSYWGIKTLGLDEGSALKMPRLLESKTLEDIPTGIWQLQPKVK